MRIASRAALCGALFTCLATAAHALTAEQVREKLAQRISVNLAETPFEKALMHLQDKAGVVIAVDRAHLTEHTLESPVTFQVGDVPAHEALRWVVKMKNADYEIQPRVVFVTTREQMSRRRARLRIYDVRDLTRDIADFRGPDPLHAVAPSSMSAGGASPGLVLIEGRMWEVTTQHLAEMVQRRVRPASWAAELGTSIEERGGKLVIVQTPEAHDEVRRLLGELRRTVGRMVHFHVRTIRVPRARLDELTAETNAGTLGPGALNALDAFVETEPERVLGSARFTCFNAQRTHSYGGTAQTFVADYEITGESYDPIVRRALPGLVADVKPVTANDGRSMLLELRLTYSATREDVPGAFRPLGNADGSPCPLPQPGVIEQPVLRIASVKTTVRVASGATVALSAGRDCDGFLDGEDIVFLVTPTTVSF
jgi:hypothetical protein